MTRDSYGRFARPHATIPLLVRKPKSRPHMHGWATRRVNRLERVLAHCAAIRRSL
jgi:hypothetical protein